jgi:cation diffusion facilitator family transporter
MRLSAVLTRRSGRVTLASGAIDLGLVVGKLTLGLLTGSLALISDAVHSLLDLTGSVFTLIAVHAAEQPADPEHPYGHGKAENLAAYSEGLLLVLAAAAIGYEAIQRLQHPTAVTPSVAALGFLVGVVALEVGRSLGLRWLGRATGHPALSALAIDKGADLLSALAVLAGLGLVRAGLSHADAAAALVVAALILAAAGRLLKQSGDVLVDRAAAVASREVMEGAASVPEVREVRSARVRRSGAQLIGEVEVSSRPTLPLGGVQGLVSDVGDAVHRRLPNIDLTVLVRSDVDPARFVERVHAVAARNGQFRDLHDVIVEREADESLHLSLHAKLPGQLSMREAARLASAFEADLKTELPQVSRVDIHLEPLEPDLIHGRDVTAEHRPLVEALERELSGHPLVSRCESIELSSRAGEITAHIAVQVPDDLLLSQAHELETELEEQVKQRFGQIKRVVVRTAV